jgi:hypothetical protein
MALFMLLNAQMRTNYSVAQLPYLKNESERKKLIKNAEKNSEIYLQLMENEYGGMITTETIFASLKKGATIG